MHVAAMQMHVCMGDERYRTNDKVGPIVGRAVETKKTGYPL